MIYQLGDIEIDTVNFKLVENGKPVAVEPQVFDLIIYLIEHRERLVSRQELFDKLWPGREVSDTSLSNHIKNARKALGDDGNLQQVISTSRCRGYQFIASVNERPQISQAANGGLKAWLTGIDHRYQVAIGSLLLVVSLLLVKLLLLPPAPPQNTSVNSVIAVLPFSNKKPDLKTDYLGFAIADQVIGNLLYLRDITVRPSGSIRQYDQQVINPMAVAKELQVDYLLMGNYLLEQNIVQLTVELINVTSNEIMWRQPITVDYKNTFELQ